MSYEDAYAELVDSALASMETINETQDVRTFVSQKAAHIRSLSSSTPEFYIGEFFNMFKDVVLERFQAERVNCQQEIDDANAEAEATTVELQARLVAIRAAGDREAEHEVWRERETRQAMCQARVDAAGKRADLLSIRLDAFQELASALNVDFV